MFKTNYQLIKMRKTINLNFNKDSEHLYDEIQRLSTLSGVPVTRLTREYIENGMKTQKEQPRALNIR